MFMYDEHGLSVLYLLYIYIHVFIYMYIYTHTYTYIYTYIDCIYVLHYINTWYIHKKDSPSTAHGWACAKAVFLAPTKPTGGLGTVTSDGAPGPHSQRSAGANNYNNTLVYDTQIMKYKKNGVINQPT